jgi:tetratricopeptide (TPR) repeat protein
LKHTPKFWILFWGIVLLLSVSCSTRKNNFTNRAYHTVTSTYNVNFNGKEALKKGIAELDKKRKDNYLETLPIYFYPPKQDLTSAFPSFDRAIEKASKSVFKHSILIRGKEHVKTMNDAYMMMGKAYFYKQDYNEAKRVFNYVSSVYKDWGSVEEATIWIARAELQQGYPVRAQSFLEEIAPLMHQKKIKTTNIRDDDELKTKSKTPPKKKSKYSKPKKKKPVFQASKSSKKKPKTAQRKITNNVRLQYYAAAAEYNLLAPNGEIEEAIDNIKIALQYRPKKDFKVRLYFILGQLYEELDNRSAAQNWFLKVIRANPEYEMEFSARMHLAVNYDGTPLSKRNIMKELNKMLKDPKNEDYRDQIYYAISEIARIDEDDADREFYLAKSVAAYTRNDYQRTFSAVTLADIFFSEEEYVQAQAYYDTALMSLPSNFPNRGELIRKASVLRDLVENLDMIHLQDSLQRIAKMSENERRSWVNRMIAQYTEEERRLAKEEADRMLALAATQNFANVNVNTQGQSRKWYFYNPGLVSQGTTEFYRRFGNRRLEDNWRISNKNVISFEDMADMNAGIEREEEEELDEDGNPIKRRETDPKKPEYYTQDLPLTPGAIDSSNMLIADAMYNASTIYFDQLNDLKRSNEMLHKLIQRFPDHDLVLPSYFLLWTNYTKLRNVPKANEAKDVILAKYPDTDYAKLILDPEYYKKLAEAAREHERKYDELHGVYSNKQWARTVQLADDLLALTEDVTLIAKTTYLRAVAIGQLEGDDALKGALTQIIQEHPKEEVAELAKIYLSIFSTNQNQTQTQVVNDGTTSAATAPDIVANVKDSPYNPNLDEQHYVIILVNIHKKAVNDVKYDVSNFNATYFRLERFNVNSFYVNQNEQLVTIARFKGKTDAMNYHVALTTNDMFASLIQDKSITVYPISASNYSIYYQKVDERRLYKQFFEENYQ